MDAQEPSSLAQTRSHCLEAQALKLDRLANLIQDATERLKGRVVLTPTIPLGWLSNPSRRVYAKIECHQNTGSFKFRGALNAAEMTTAPSIVTAIAGNHALATCRAARISEKESTVIAPVNVSETKAKRIMTDVDKLVYYGNDLSEATREALRMENEVPGLRYISPFDDVDVAAGAGMQIVEAFEDAGPFDYVVVPLGGGCLAAAVASWYHVHSPSTKIICVHPAVFGRSMGKSDTLGQVFFLPLFFQGVKRLSALLGGVVVMILAGTLIPCSIISGMLLTKFGRYRWDILAGWAIMTAGFGLLTLLTPTSATYTWVLILIFLGIGFGLLLTGLNFCIQATARSTDDASAASMYTFLRASGICIGVAVPSIFFQNGLADELQALQLPLGRAQDATKLILDLKDASLSDDTRQINHAKLCIYQEQKIIGVGPPIAVHPEIQP